MVDDANRLARKASARIVSLRCLRFFSYFFPFLLAGIFGNEDLIALFLLVLWPTYKMYLVEEDLECTLGDLKKNRRIDPIFMDLFIYRVESPIWKAIFFRR